MLNSGTREEGGKDSGLPGENLFVGSLFKIPLVVARVARVLSRFLSVARTL